MEGAEEPAGSGLSAICASLVISRPAIDEASIKAVLTTLVGSIIPALIRST